MVDLRVARPAASPAGAGTARRRTRVRPDFGGAVMALLLFGFSLTPSLLPRHWIIQAVVSGILMGFGYGIGVAIGALVRRWWPTASPARRPHWLALGAVGVVGVTGLLAAGAGWQRELGLLAGGAITADWPSMPLVLLTTAVFSLLVLVARAVRLVTRRVRRLLAGFLPEGAAAVAAVAAVAVLGVGFGHQVVLPGAVGLASERAARANAALDPAVPRPTSSYRSGGPGSLVSWESLGAAGREFVAGAATTPELALLAPDPTAPIRVYVGLESADSAARRAALAVAELERTGGFARSVIAVVTTTGTGWVNPAAALALEHLHGGDTALVATQYSYLPSWISFATDRASASESAALLIDAVRARLDRLPAAERPRLVLYGESLGAYATEQAFTDLADLAATVDGALLVGPPHASPIWQSTVAARHPASPVWRPADRSGLVRFGPVGPDPVGFGPRPRVVYLQHASDPIVWWSPELLYRPPAWLADRGPGVSEGMRWYPLVTFWQVSGDLANSTSVPAGHGHSYRESLADAWAALIPPPDWTDARTVRLRHLLSDRMA